MKIGDIIISKAALWSYPKWNWDSEIWEITGEDIYKDGTERWELKKVNFFVCGCYRKDFVKEAYIAYNPILEIIYG